MSLCKGFQPKDSLEGYCTRCFKYKKIERNYYFVKLLIYVINLI